MEESTEQQGEQQRQESPEPEVKATTTTASDFAPSEAFDTNTEQESSYVLQDDSVAQNSRAAQQSSAAQNSHATSIGLGNQISSVPQVNPAVPVSSTSTPASSITSATQVGPEASPAAPISEGTQINPTVHDSSATQGTIVAAPLQSSSGATESVYPSENKPSSTPVVETVQESVTQAQVEAQLPAAANPSYSSIHSNNPPPEHKSRDVSSADQSSTVTTMPASKPTKLPTPLSTKPPKETSQGTAEILPANHPMMSKQHTGVSQERDKSSPANLSKPQASFEPTQIANITSQTKPTSDSKAPVIPKVIQQTPTSVTKKPQEPKKPSDVQNQTADVTSPSKRTRESVSTVVPSSPPEKTANQQSPRSSGSSSKTPGRELTLYFNYSSYYSQKVLLALYEKDLIFTPHKVALDKNEQFEPSFIAINPKAEIPVLKVGDKYITDSEVIMNYIGRLPISAGNALVGDSRSSSGQTIQRFRRLIDGINIPLLTYGIVYQPQLGGGNLNIPTYVQDQMKERASNKLNVLSRLSETHPDHRACYLTLSEDHAEKYEACNDEEAVRRELKQLGRVLGTVEEQLTKICDVNELENSDKWLCGTDFTAADISLLVLLTRLQLLGLLTQYVEDSPMLRGYFTRGSARTSYQRLMKEIKDAKSNLLPFLYYNSKRALPYVGGVTALGAAAGVAYWVYKKVT